MNTLRFTAALFLLSACSGTMGPGIPDSTTDVDPTEELTGSQKKRARSNGTADSGDVVDSGLTETDASQRDASSPISISSFSSTRTELAVGRSQATTFTEVSLIAVLANENGLDAIAGGTLVDESGVTYGAFAQKDGLPGTFTFNLTWEAVNAARPLTFIDSASRSFTARFFDKDGHKAAASVSIAFRCDAFADNTDAFRGVCTNTRVDAKHCGDTFTVCASNEACREGACTSVKSRTTYDPTFDTTKTCATTCSKHGQMCEFALSDTPAAYAANCETPFTAIASPVDCHCYK